MKATIDYLLYIDIAGLMLAMLLVRQANRLNKRVKNPLKRANVDAQEKGQRLKDSVRIPEPGMR